MRLKPHEAQSYRKKALWVSWVSIAVTIILAIVAFSEFSLSPVLRLTGSAGVDGAEGVLQPACPGAFAPGDGVPS